MSYDTNNKYRYKDKYIVLIFNVNTTNKYYK